MAPIKGRTRIAPAPRSGRGRAYRALGFVFGLRTDEDRLGDFAARVLDPLAIDDPEIDDDPRVVYDLITVPANQSAPISGAVAGRSWELRRGRETIARGAEVGEVLAALFVDINRQVLATTSDSMLIHAAAAAIGRRGLIFPAPSGAGKTTLVAGLVHRGLSYLTDEITAISLADRRIHAYPKALSVKPGSRGVLADLDRRSATRHQADPVPEWHLDPRTIRADAVIGWADPAFVIAPTYLAGAVTELVAIPRSQAVFLLAQHSFNLGDHGHRGLEVLADAVRGCDCYRLVVGDLESACDLIHGLITDGAGPTDLDHLQRLELQP